MGCTCVWEGAGKGLWSSSLPAPLASESSLCVLMVPLYREEVRLCERGGGGGLLLATVPLDPLLVVARTPG